MLRLVGDGRGGLTNGHRIARTVGLRTMILSGTATVAVILLEGASAYAFPGAVLFVGGFALATRTRAGWWVMFVALAIAAGFALGAGLPQTTPMGRLQYATSGATRLSVAGVLIAAIVQALLLTRDVRGDLQIAVRRTRLALIGWLAAFVFSAGVTHPTAALGLLEVVFGQIVSVIA